MPLQEEFNIKRNIDVIASWLISTRNSDKRPAYGLTTLLADLGLLTLNAVKPPSSSDDAFLLRAMPTRLQA